MMGALASVGAFLLSHADLLSEIVQAIESGTPKEALRDAIRAAKVQVSDEVMKEELGVK